MTRFPIARSPIWRPPLLLIGATSALSVVTLELDVIDLRFGVAHVRVPYTNIRSVARREWFWWGGIGLRIAADKTLGLIGTTTGVVHIALKEPSPERVLFIRPHNIAVSLEDPDGFIRAVEERLAE